METAVAGILWLIALVFAWIGFNIRNIIGWFIPLAEQQLKEKEAELKDATNEDVLNIENDRQTIQKARIIYFLGQDSQIWRTLTGLILVIALTLFAVGIAIAR